MARGRRDPRSACELSGVATSAVQHVASPGESLALMSPSTCPAWEGGGSWSHYAQDGRMAGGGDKPVARWAAAAAPGAPPLPPGKLMSGAPRPGGRVPQGWNSHGAFPGSAVLCELRPVK